MIALADEHRPLTLRQLYYRLVAEDAVEKTQAGYRRVMRQLKVLRRSRRIPWGWVVDNSRAYYGVNVYGSLADFLDASTSLYRRDLWAASRERVELWCESDSIAGPISRVSEPWHVRVYPVKGFASDGFVMEAADEMADRRLPTFAYYFGDFDPSGESIGLDLERKLRAGLVEFGADPDLLVFSRVAVNEAQIEELDLPTRPAKTSDTRTARWNGRGTVEIEALPPAYLRELVEGCIFAHLDHAAVQRSRRIEREERETLAQLAGGAS